MDHPRGHYPEKIWPIFDLQAHKEQSLSSVDHSSMCYSQEDIHKEPAMSQIQEMG
jgi:hypothetical protein